MVKMTVSSDALMHVQMAGGIRQYIYLIYACIHVILLCGALHCCIRAQPDPHSGGQRQVSGLFVSLDFEKPYVCIQWENRSVIAE